MQTRDFVAELAEFIQDFGRQIDEEIDMRVNKMISCWEIIEIQLNGFIFIVMYPIKEDTFSCEICFKKSMGTKNFLNFYGKSQVSHIIRFHSLRKVVILTFHAHTCLELPLLGFMWLPDGENLLRISLPFPVMTNVNALVIKADKNGTRRTIFV